MKGKIVTHAKLQYYRHNYCLVCMTGLLGCRWHRYQQSTRDNRKRDLACFVFVLLAFLFMIFYFYFWLIACNDIHYITLNMYPRVEAYVPWYSLGLGLASVAFAYFTVVTLLCLLHVWHGHQLYVHPFHTVVTALTLACCVLVTILVSVYWPQEWPLLLISLKVFGPFLHIIAVTLLTVASIVICRQWFKITRTVVRWVWLGVFCACVLAVYLSPLAIDSPLVRSDTPSKPHIVALDGASKIVPENTLVAFQKSLQLHVSRFYSTVQLSADGVPFLFTDYALDRTTSAGQSMGNVTYSGDPTLLTMDQLAGLDAGSWFLEDDPWGTASDLSGADESTVRSQGVLTLADLVNYLAASGGKSSELFLQYRPLTPAHPLWKANGGQYPLEAAINSVLRNVSDHGLMDLAQFATPVRFNRLQGVRGLLEGFRPDLVSLHGRESLVALLSVSDLCKDHVRQYQRANVTTVAMSVNSDWLLSYVWTLGVDTALTYDLNNAQRLHDPIWHMSSGGYLGLWISLDVISAILIAIIFIVQRIRLYGTKFSPESISLNTGRAKTSYRSRTMKEKLLRGGEGPEDMEGSSGVLNQPAVYSMASGHQAYSLTSLPVLSSASSANEGARELSADSPAVMVSCGDRQEV